MFPSTKVMPLAWQNPNPDGTERDTTALFNPQWDRFYDAIAQAEGQTPDEHGVTHLSIGGQFGNQDIASPSLKALRLLKGTSNAV